jgi:hypothetical protein
MLVLACALLGAGSCAQLVGIEDGRWRESPAGSGGGTSDGGAAGTADGSVGGHSGRSGHESTAGAGGASGADGGGGGLGGGAGSAGDGGSTPFTLTIDWVRQWGGAGDETVTVATTDGAHGVVFAGRLTTDTTFAPGLTVPVTSAETRYFVRQSADGDVLFAGGFRAKTAVLHGLVPAAAGGSWLAAGVEGDLVPIAGEAAPSFVPPTLGPPGTGRSPTVLRLTENGSIASAYRAPSPYGETTSIVRTGAGLFVAGTFSASLAIDATTSRTGSDGVVDAFVARLDEDTGAFVPASVHTFVGGALTAAPVLVARSDDPQLGPALLLPCSAAFAIDGAAASTVPCAGLAFVPLVDATANLDTGNIRDLAVPAVKNLQAIRADDGALVVASSFTGTASFPSLVDTPLVSSGEGSRVLLLRLSSDGVVAGAKPLGGVGTHGVNALAADPLDASAVLFGGWASGTTDSENGAASATPPGQANAFFGRLRTDLSIVWLRLAPGVGAGSSQQVSTLVADQAALFVGASMAGAFVIGDPAKSAGNRDILSVHMTR